MGKPRMIIIIRHAQSEGNQNRQIHQIVPDHRVKLTTEGWKQAHDAGHRLRSMLHPSDTLQIYTSPYRRTRETTQGILESLTSDSPQPSPFSGSSIKVWEEPRIREQDFGNFQPCSAAMERMWRERADYGHFFYRIPNGESAADAYDRVSGFNESLWRSFGEDDFPSVCVIVTHGLMSRVFLMKWFHWSVEYFEDLRNFNHCEFVTMTKGPESGKYTLQTQLRTWSEYKRHLAAEKGDRNPSDVVSPPIRKRWGGCPDGCSHNNDECPRWTKQKDTDIENVSDPKQSEEEQENKKKEAEVVEEEEEDEAFPPVESNQTESDSKKWQLSNQSASEFSQHFKDSQRLRKIPTYIQAGRDFGGSASGAGTPAYEIDQPEISINQETPAIQANSASGTHEKRELQWIKESGMGSGARADALGDQEDTKDGETDEPYSAEQIEDLEKYDKSIRGSVY